jgi:hypothetical protein
MYFTKIELLNNRHMQYRVQPLKTKCEIIWWKVLMYLSEIYNFNQIQFGFFVQVTKMTLIKIP